MKKLVILCGLVLSACANPHTGQVDPVATGALVVGAGTLGYIVGQQSVPHYHYHLRTPTRPRVYNYHYHHHYHYRHHYHRW